MEKIPQTKILIIIKKARKRIIGIKYRAKNKEKLAIKKSKYYQENKERLCAKSRKYEKDNEVKVKAKKKEYREKNKEYISEWKKDNYHKNKKKISIKREEWKQNNKEKIKAYKKEWSNSEIGRASKRIDRLRRRALRISTEDGSITKESLEELRVNQDNKCFYCRNELDFVSKNKAHLDHYYPLSKGGTHTIENVVWSCSSCNLIKGAKIPERLLI